MAKVLQSLRVKRKGDVKVLMTGLNAAGKSTILCQLKHGKATTQLPTIGYNVETIDFKGLSFVIWDFSGKNTKCPLSEQLQEYCRSTIYRALIFVVDSKDSYRLLKCKEELWSLLDIDDLRDVIVLVIANKQDLHGAMSVEEIRKTLDIEKIVDREIDVQGACATKGDGLKEGLTWIQQKITEQEKKGEVVPEKHLP